MADSQASTRKRKRSSVACRPCHNRKVRCNILVQGTPCSNCQQDGSQCEVYQRSIGLPGQPTSIPQTSAIQPPPSTRDISIRSIIDGDSLHDHVVQHDLNYSLKRNSNSTRSIHCDDQSITVDGPLPFPPDTNDFMPYYAGESEGLEFLFDQCNPDRRDRGPHYITPRKTYRHKRLTQGPRKLAPRLPHRAIQQELVKCFFHHVWPVMPILNASEFLDAFENDMSSISPLLLWSVFFSALSYVDETLLRWNKLKPRKVLKEKYYQAAKDIYDRQEEDDKTVLIQSALLLGMWYVDLEDRDGSWFWVGTAISLCHTIGLHRASTYSSMNPIPFSDKLRRLWRRMWWATFYRESWLAMGFGRPVRVHFDDCDEDLPSKDDIMQDIKDLPDHLRQQYVPLDVSILTESWVVLVSLGTVLNQILTMHYRPRSRLPLPSVLLEQETEIMKLRTQLPTTETLSSYATVHRCHFEMYFNSVLITLYRPYLACQPEQLEVREELTCREQVIQKARKAANDTSTQVNKLMSMDAIDQSPSTFMAATMTSMQILVFELRNSTHLGRGYARNQLGLHMLVLERLRKTYWTADVQHTLFTTVLKSLGNGLPGVETSRASIPDDRPGEMGPPRQLPNTLGSPNTNTNPSPSPILTPNQQEFETDQEISYEAYLATFRPFAGLPTYSDDLGASDWDVSDSVSLGGSIHSTHSNHEETSVTTLIEPNATNDN